MQPVIVLSPVYALQEPFRWMNEFGWCGGVSMSHSSGFLLNTTNLLLKFLAYKILNLKNKLLRELLG